jgi:hypothetical protein
MKFSDVHVSGEGSHDNDIFLIPACIGKQMPHKRGLPWRNLSVSNHARPHLATINTEQLLLAHCTQEHQDRIKYHSVNFITENWYNAPVSKVLPIYPPLPPHVKCIDWIRPDFHHQRNITAVRCFCGRSCNYLLSTTNRLLVREWYSWQRL